MNIEDQFAKAFGKLPEWSGFTPGRVNLIGEHTDYNGGYVLPTALALGLNIALSPRDDNHVCVSSASFDDLAKRTLGESPSDHWSDYALGAITLAKSEGLLKGGANVAVSTDLPFGAGLSSSAALTVGILRLCDSDTRLTDTEISVLARRVENEFIGMPCGIMDQMAVAIARPGQALALDTKSLNYDVVDLPADYQMAVIHSGVYRKLSEGRYKTRKEECDAVKAALGHDDICLITDAEFASLSDLDTPLIRRARHVMTEHRRTLAAIDALRENDLVTFGALMKESHASMRDDFEITLSAIDKLVSDAVAFGALGARMTGGGFGGCIVACVPRMNLKTWTKQLLAAHPKAFFVC